MRPTQTPTGAGEAKLIAAKNEFESFQIVVQAGSSTLTGLSVGLKAPLSGAGGVIPAGNVTIYKENYYNVQEPSDLEGSIGKWPDPLVPITDTLYGGRAGGQNGLPFPAEVPANENNVIWVDVLAPTTAAAGVYTGTIAVTAQGLSVDVPVQLTILDFAIPSTASLHSAFSIDPEAPCKAAKKDGHECSTAEDGWRLDAQYAQVALDDRITIARAHYADVSTPANRQLFETYVLPLLDGSSKARLSGARLTSFQVDGRPENNFAQLRDWQAEAQARGFLDRSFIWLRNCDEPGNVGANDKWRACGADIDQARAAVPGSGIAVVVFANNQQADAARSAYSTDFLAKTNWLAPLLNRMDDKPTSDGGAAGYQGDQHGAYQSFLQGANKQLWIYTSCMSHGCEPGGEAAAETCISKWPTGPSSAPTTNRYFNGWAGYAIDEPATEARATGWLASRYGITGELYFDTGHCLPERWETQYAYGGNGDGTLFYSGVTTYTDAAGTSVTAPIPLESLRMKLIRDGYEDYELIKIARNRGKGPDAERIAEHLFAHPYNTDAGDADVQTARLQLICLISPGVLGSVCTSVGVTPTPLSTVATTPATSGQPSATVTQGPPTEQPVTGSGDDLFLLSLAAFGIAVLLGIGAVMLRSASRQRTDEWRID